MMDTNKSNAIKSQVLKGGLDVNNYIFSIDTKTTNPEEDI